MKRQEIFEQSLIMINELRIELYESNTIDCGVRLELAKDCVCISIEHGDVVRLLLASDYPIQAMVLLRSQYEAVVKSYWIMFIATNEQISRLNFNWTNEEQKLKDKFPMVSEMLNLLDNANLDARHIIKQLKEFKEYNLNPLNSFVHTGKHSFIRNSVGFDEDFIIKLTAFSNNLATTACQLIFKHTIPDRQKFLITLHEKYIDCFA